MIFLKHQTACRESLFSCTHGTGFCHATAGTGTHAEEPQASLLGHTRGYI